MRSALVLGGTGLIGGHLVELLLQHPEYDRVRVLGRRPLGRQHSKLEERVMALNQMAEEPSLFAVDDLFCCLGSTIKQAGSQAAFRQVDYEYPLQAAQLAKGAGVQRYLLVTAMGANPSSRIFYNRVKGEVEEAVAAVGLPTCLILRPSLLLGERSALRPGEAMAAVISRLIDPVMVGPLAKVRAIKGETVARAMLRAALQDRPGLHYLPSDELQRLGKPE